MNIVDVLRAAGSLMDKPEKRMRSDLTGDEMSETTKAIRIWCREWQSEAEVETWEYPYWEPKHSAAHWVYLNRWMLLAFGGKRPKIPLYVRLHDKGLLIFEIDMVFLRERGYHSYPELIETITAEEAKGIIL